MKFYLVQINTKVGDFAFNCDRILREFENAQKENCDLVIFPEMALTGYDARDLWLREDFIKDCDSYLQKIIDATKSSNCAILLGAPYLEKNKIYNCAILIEKGEVQYVVKKKILPNFGVFDEARYFSEAPTLSYAEFRGKTLSILVCEDMWDAKNLYLLQEQIFDFSIVINSSPFEIDKQEKRLKIAQNMVAKTKKPLIYVNQIGGQDCLVFDGASFVLDENCQEILKLKEFEEDAAIVDFQKLGGILADKKSPKNLGQEEKIYKACALGLRDYVAKTGFRKVLLGMSGGIDSALVAAIAVDALGKENVALYALPSRYNSKESMDDALETAKNLGVELQVISIEKTFTAMLETLENQELSSLAKENLQSRIRGNILMALSNSSGALLLSTGNKSEMGVGYATLYGDMCGGFNPIKDLYKTQVYDVAKWRNLGGQVIAKNILTKEPTAELRENQKDCDSLPPYEILDKILYQLIEEQKSVENIVSMGYDKITVEKAAKLLKNSEFKRQQAPIGVKLSKMSFDRDRRYPIASGFKN